MRVQSQDVFHGIALTQLVEHPSFIALNKASGRHRHYLLNQDRRLFVKYTKIDKSPWQFVFNRGELRAINEDLGQKGHTFVVLVCGHWTVCALDAEDIGLLLDLNRLSQWVRVEAPRRRSMSVIGSQNSLPAKVPHNSYPRKLFE